MPDRTPPTFSRRRPAGASRASSGFTILELIVVIAIIGILAAIVAPQLMDKPRRAKEAVLKTNLWTLRDVIDQHYADRGHYPTSLEVLVEAGYLRSIPIDPITESAETWLPEYEEIDPDIVPAETDLPEGGEPGIINVYSGSEELSLDGTPYTEW